MIFVKTKTREEKFIDRITKEILKNDIKSFKNVVNEIKQNSNNDIIKFKILATKVLIQLPEEILLNSYLKELLVKENQTLEKVIDSLSPRIKALDYIEEKGKEMEEKINKVKDFMLKSLKHIAVTAFTIGSLMGVNSYANEIENIKQIPELQKTIKFLESEYGKNISCKIDGMQLEIDIKGKKFYSTILDKEHIRESFNKVFEKIKIHEIKKEFYYSLKDYLKNTNGVNKQEMLNSLKEFIRIKAPTLDKEQIENILNSTSNRLFGRDRINENMNDFSKNIDSNKVKEKYLEVIEFVSSKIEQKYQIISMR